MYLRLKIEELADLEDVSSSCVVAPLLEGVALRGVVEFDGAGAFGVDPQVVRLAKE